MRKIRAERKLKIETDKKKREFYLNRINECCKARNNYPSLDEMDSSYRRLKYIRYADDFLIGIIGSKADCVKVKKDIKDFLGENSILNYLTKNIDNQYKEERKIPRI